MLANMRKLTALPAETVVFCAHEYTQSNLKFLSSIDAKCNNIYEEVINKRNQNIPTVPTTIGEEKMYNLFCRCDDEEVMMLVEGKDAEDTMRLLREKKNNFR